MSHRWRFPVLCALVLALAPAAALTVGGGALRDIGDYTVHYNAMPASELDPAVAARYDLPHGEKRCVVTVAVIEDRTGAMVDAEIVARATRSDGRMFRLEMRAITDADGRYYLGELPLEGPATIDFVLEVQPEPEMAPQTIHFRRRLPAP